MKQKTFRIIAIIICMILLAFTLVGRNHVILEVIETGSTERTTLVDISYKMVGGFYENRNFKNQGRLERGS